MASVIPSVSYNENHGRDEAPSDFPDNRSLRFEHKGGIFAEISQSINPHDAGYFEDSVEKCRRTDAIIVE